MLNIQACRLIANWFLSGHTDLGIPGPSEGMQLLHHAEKMRKMVKEFSDLNPGADKLPEVMQIRLYIACLEGIAGDLLVLQVIPLEALQRSVDQSKEEVVSG